MTQKESYQSKMEHLLQQWGVKIDHLRAQAEQMGEASRETYFSQVDELKAKQEIAVIKLQALREAGVEAWEELKAGVDNATAELRQSLETAGQSFPSARSA